ALRDVRRDVTWRQLDRETAALAATVRERLDTGGRLLILSGNRLEILEAYFTAARAGGVAVPVNPGLPPAGVAPIAGNVAPRLGLADEEGRRRIAASHPDLPVLSIEDIAGSEATPAPWPAGPEGAGEPVAILHTSATTGRAKGVVFDQRVIAHN